MGNISFQGSDHLALTPDDIMLDIIPRFMLLNYFTDSILLILSAELILLNTIDEKKDVSTFKLMSMS